MDSDKLREIAERVEKLTGPSPQLDAEIFSVAVYRRDRLDQHPLRYTSSVDAAMALVPAGLSLGFTVPYQRDAIVSAFWPRPRADLWKPLDQAVGRGEAATTPLALTAAALRAIAASQEQRRG